MLLASFLGFLLLFLLIGFSSVLVRSKEQSDYLLAGSSVPPSLIGLSAVATNNSGFMFIGVIGYTYATGLPAFTMMVGWILGDWMAATLVTRKVREVSEERGTLTIPELLSRWGGGHFQVLKVVAALIAVLLLGVYAAAQFKAGGKALQALFDWDLRTGAIIGAVMVLCYGFSGGLRASVWTDAAQSVVMIVAMTVMLTTAVFTVGGWQSAWTGLHDVSPTFFQFFPADSAASGLTGVLLFLVGWTFAGAAVIGQPHVMVRFMAVNDVKNVRRARTYYYLWFVAFYTLAVGVGMMARLLMDQGAVDPSLVMSGGEQAGQNQPGGHRVQQHVRHHRQRQLGVQLTTAHHQGRVHRALVHQQARHHADAHRQGVEGHEPQVIVGARPADVFDVVDRHEADHHMGLADHRRAGEGPADQKQQDAGETAGGGVGGEKLEEGG